MIGIVDYGSGNFSSVFNSIKLIHSDIKTISNPSDLEVCSKIILPGVGAFKTAMERLAELNLLSALNDAVLVRKKPFLGICVGMQILAKEGNEFENTLGLGWINGSVNRFELTQKDLVLPHIGWNEVMKFEGQDLFDGLDPDEPSFYFVHSYHLELDEMEIKNVKVTYSNYEKPFIAAIQKDNIFGVQFHPEKSQRNGIKLLGNFLKYNG